MPALNVRLLGQLELLDENGEPLSAPPTLNSQSLLAYLVLHRNEPQPRDRLAGLFWGDRPERKARRSLSTALWHVRRSLPDEGVILSGMVHQRAEIGLHFYFAQKIISPKQHWKTAEKPPFLCKNCPF